MSIHDKLSNVQSCLSVPKSQTNAFGKYKYRSCEDILEALKPLLKEHGLVLTLSDSIEMIGARYYVKATATVGIVGTAEQIAIHAYAREEEEKKGMDGAQVTGAASSYARKYALNGLFCIDDTKDADTMDNRKDETPKAESIPDVLKPMPGQLEEIERLLKETDSDKAALLKFIGLPANVVITPGIAVRMIEALKKKLNKQLDAAA